MSEHVVAITSETHSKCEHCDLHQSDTDFAGMINHYLEKHGYTFSHSSQESSHNSEGEPYRYSLALLVKK